jgi:hypothetical protein
MVLDSADRSDCFPKRSRSDILGASQHGEVAHVKRSIGLAVVAVLAIFTMAVSLQAPSARAARLAAATSAGAKPTPTASGSQSPGGTNPNVGAVGTGPGSVPTIPNTGAGGMSRHAPGAVVRLTGLTTGRSSHGFSPLIPEFAVLAGLLALLVGRGRLRLRRPIGLGQ